MEPAEQAEEGGDRWVGDQGPVDGVASQACDEMRRSCSATLAFFPRVHLGNIGRLTGHLDEAGASSSTDAQSGGSLRVGQQLNRTQPGIGGRQVVHGHQLVRIRVLGEGADVFAHRSRRPEGGVHRHVLDVTTGG